MSRADQLTDVLNVRAETVFSRIPSILNLIAFVAHAVLGCCGHHQHGNTASCCGNTVQSRHSEDAGHCCTSDSGHHDDAQRFGNDCENEFGEVPGDSNPDQGCNEGRCSYVGTATRLDSLTELGEVIQVLWIRDSIALSTTVSCGDRYVCRGIRFLWATPPKLCATLQSWQI